MRKRVGPVSKIWVFALGVLVLGLPLWLWQASGKAETVVLPEYGAYFGVSNVDAKTAADLEAAIDRGFKVQRMYSDSAVPNIMNGNSEAQDAAIHGRIPWQSIKTHKWESVAQGSHDNDIDRFADKVKSFAKPMIITINYEPEDELDSSGNTSANYIALWRRYVDRFAQRGVTNVTWAWVVKASSLKQGDPLYTQATSLYPGDDYVDIIGIDAHNTPYDVKVGYDDCKARGEHEPKAKDTADLISNRSKYPCQSDYYADHVLDVQWTNLHDLVSGAYQWATTTKVGAHDIPIGIADYGSTYDWRNDARRGEWITTAREKIKTMPLIKIVNYAQYPEWKLGWPSGNQGQDTAAFKEMGQDSYYQGLDSPPPDTTPPTVQILAPTEGTYEGIINSEVAAEDNVDVDRVSFLANDTWLFTDYEAPYEFDANTTTDHNGDYVLSAVAYDVAGNMGESTPVNIVVDNVVEQAPVIHSFTAQPAAVVTGESTVLSWVVTGPSGCSISPNGPQNISETSWITPPHTEVGVVSYELQCSNEFGTSNQKLDVTVTAAPTPPEKPIFGASSTEIMPGEDVLLGWSSAGATSCELDPGNIISVGDSASRLVENIYQTTTFTLVCFNDAGQTAADPITVTVTDTPAPQPPEILVFKAEPDKVTSGQTSTVTWQTMNVKQNGCNITPSSAKAVPANGKVTTAPLTTSRSYTLTCVNTAGQAVTAGLTIIVDDIPPPPLPPSELPQETSTPPADTLTVSEELANRIVKVEYYIDGKLVQTYTSAPYTFDQTQLEPGTYTVTQRIYFNDGFIGERTQVITIPAPFPTPMHWLMIVTTLGILGGCLRVRFS